MGQSEVRNLINTLPPNLFVLIIAILNNQSSQAQQLYDTGTYTCSDFGAQSCSAFALYRAQNDYTDLTSIATLFNTNETTLADLNSLPASGKLAMGQTLIVPLTCICFNQTSYANLTHIIAAGDDFYDLNVNAFESLSTTEAVIEANPSLNYMDLVIGTEMVFPARCACPSQAQIGDGVEALVTYPVQNGDSTGEV
ncbi:unnamed protein product [Calypogeia fissa]